MPGVQMTTTPSEKPAFEQWAVVELMGHRVRAGHVSEVEMFGGRMLRIDLHETSEKKIGTEFYGAHAIYGITVTTAEACFKMNAPYVAPTPMLMAPRAFDLAETADDGEDQAF